MKDTSDLYFSDKEVGQKPRENEQFTSTVWGGIVAIIESSIANSSLAIDFPDECPDGNGISGIDVRSFQLALRAEIPEIDWPLREDQLPPTLAILDLIEFCHRHVAEPIQHDYHSFFRHHHLTFDREKGKTTFRERVNRVFSRNGLAFVLKDNGSIERLVATVLSDALKRTIFNSGDQELDSMLETAIKKYYNADPQVRREALEKLWDAWERLKTIEKDKDKRASIEAIISKVAPERKFRELINREAKELTSVGNSFQIRHSETNQVPIRADEHIDYLFHRLFALIRMILDKLKH